MANPSSRGHTGALSDPGDALERLMEQIDLLTRAVDELAQEIQWQNRQLKDDLSPDHAVLPYYESPPVHASPERIFRLSDQIELPPLTIRFSRQPTLFG